MKLTIVIPAYNEQDTIVAVIGTVDNAANQLTEISEYEILVVDDGSDDETAKIVQELVTPDAQIRLLSQTRNGGKGAALRRAFREARGDIVLIQDADLEYSPDDYPTMIRPIANGKADVVYGSRFKGDTMRVLFFWHYAGNKFLTLLSNMLTNLNLSDMETGYKLFRRDILDTVELVSDRFGIEPELTAKLAKVPDIRIYEVPVSYFGRTYEDGKKIGWRDGVAAVWFIVKFNLFDRAAYPRREVKASGGVRRGA